MNRRIGASLLSAALVIPAIAVRAQAPADPQPPAERPYFADLDLSLPSQSLFAGWPGEELRQRPYWLPWSIVTFQRASLFRRPVVFVLTVNWSRAAQKMQSAVLSHPRVLENLNQNYLTILVNADRRPDLRERYQTGTWPVVHFLLPNSHPMLSSVNEPADRRPISAGAVDVEGMLFLLDEGVKYWDKYDRQLMAVGALWSAGEGAAEPVRGEVDVSASDELARALLGNADRRNGGFGLAPKYIRPGLLEYATARALRGQTDFLSHARSTISGLVHSPLFDRVEGGLHRLATLPNWEGIQYEKMLTGNTAWIRELTLSLRIEDDSDVRQALQLTCDFLVDQLSHGEGGFFLAQVADPNSEDGGDYWRATPRDPKMRPPVDFQVHGGPTALAGAALIRAGGILHDDRIVARGKQALEYVLVHGYRPGRGLDHTLFPNRSQRLFLTTQADGALAFVDAYQTTGDVRYLDAAEDLIRVGQNNLRVSKHAALLDRLPESRPLGLLANDRRPFAANVRFASALQQLGAVTGNEQYRSDAAAILSEFTGNLPAFGTFALEAGIVLERLIESPIVVELKGEEGAALSDLRDAAIHGALPGLFVVRGDPSGPASAEVTAAGSTRRYNNVPALNRFLLDTSAMLRTAGQKP